MCHGRFLVGRLLVFCLLGAFFFGIGDWWRMVERRRGCVCKLSFFGVKEDVDIFELKRNVRN